MRLALGVAALCCAHVPAASAERLPVKIYTSADGLGANHVRCVRRDSRGFMWFCTSDGVSRFDGDAFVTYTVRDGLPHPTVNDLIEYPAGVYWIATNGGGVCRLDLRGGTRPRVNVLRVGNETWTNRVNVLHLDRAHRIWAGTDSGLFRLDEAASAFVAVDLRLREPAEIFHVHGDRDDALWISTSEGLIVLGRDRSTFHAVRHLPSNAGAVRLAFIDRHEALWLGSASRVTRLASKAAPNADRPTSRTAGELPRLTRAHDVRSIYEHSDGRVLIGGANGLAEFDGHHFRTYTDAHGLGIGEIRAIGEDRVGNVWIGSEDSGVARIARRGFVTYNATDGLDPSSVAAVFESNSGELGLVLGGLTNRISVWNGERFDSLAVRLPSDTNFGWGSGQLVLQDRAGEWWVPSESGLVRFPAVTLRELPHARPIATYAMKDALNGGLIFRQFEDSRGDIWVGTFSSERNRLFRWDRASGRFHAYTEADGLGHHNAPTVFTEDRAGNVWIGFYEGGVARYRNGRVEPLAGGQGVPPGQIRSMLVSQSGRLWIATGLGELAYTDRPEAEVLRFLPYRSRDRLSSHVIFALAEDAWGRLYVASARGIDRLEPATGRWLHYGADDGLGAGPITCASRDRHGALWFGTRRGVSRLEPEPQDTSETPDVLISRVRVGGELWPVSELGERRVTLPEVPAGRNQLQIQFFAVAFGLGRRLRYQYRLEGIDQEWSPPTEERFVNYARLAPGQYRFVVRPASPANAATLPGASVSLRILPPIWQRGWFLAIAGGAALLLVFGAHRYRVGHLIALERVRMRIAMDLHDEIGSNLSQIAVLGEVVRQRAGGNAPAVAEPMSRIAEVSRESVAAMSDIVWAIDPSRDTLVELEQRMRRFANDVLAPRDIAVRFPPSETAGRLTADADLRRNVFLIFKEAINNVVRHADATEAQIAFSVRAHRVVLSVKDNGKGLSTSDGCHGLGQRSMRQRALGLGGTLDVASLNGHGTTLTLTVPLTHRRPSRRRNAFPSSNF